MAEDKLYRWSHKRTFLSPTLGWSQTMADLCSSTSQKHLASTHSSSSMTKESQKGFNSKGFCSTAWFFCFFQDTARLQASPAGSSGKHSVTPSSTATFFLGESEALNYALCSPGHRLSHVTLLYSKRRTQARTCGVKPALSQFCCS